MVGVRRRAGECEASDQTRGGYVFKAMVNDNVSLPERRLSLVAPKLKSMGKDVIKPLKDVLLHLDSGEAIVRFEERPTEFLYGVENYGEVLGHRNSADGDLWDVFAPGYEKLERSPVNFGVESIIGMLKLSDGNHKIAVKLKGKLRHNKAKAKTEIDNFCNGYLKAANKKRKKKNKKSLKGSWLRWDPQRRQMTRF